MNETQKNFTIEQSVEIECTVNFYGNSDLPKISWTRNETEFLNRTEFFNQTSFNSKISFNPPKRNDTGIYTCSVLDKTLRNSLSIKFDLSFHCKFLFII